MATIKYLKDVNDERVYPVTHEKAVRDSSGTTLENKLRDLESKTYIIAWGGSSTPTVSNIPSGITVTYNETTYTGTKAANSSTVGKIYLVKNGNDFDRYITSQSGSSYSWVPMGSTSIDLSLYATAAQVEGVSAELDGIRGLVADKEVINLAECTLRNYQINKSTLKYTTNDEYKHIVVPVSAGDIITVTTVHAAQIAWLRSNATPSSGGTPPLVANTTVIDIDANTVVSETAPVGATYLYVYMGAAASLPWAPRGLSILKGHIPSIVDSLESADTGAALSANQGSVLKRMVDDSVVLSKNNIEYDSTPEVLTVSSCKITNNTRVVSGTSSDIIKYIPVSAGDIVRVTASNTTSAYLRHGVTTSVPAINVYVNGSTLLSGTSVDNIYEVPLDGYFCTYSTDFTNTAITIYKKTTSNERAVHNSSQVKLLLNFLGLEDIEEIPYVLWFKGFCYYSDGTVNGDSETLSYSMKLSTNGKRYMFYTRNVSTGSGQAGLAFYDENGDYVSGQRQETGAEAFGYVLTVLRIPDTAVEFRTSLSNVSLDNWFCFLTDNENILKFGSSSGGSAPAASDGADFALHLLGIPDYESAVLTGWNTGKFVYYSTGELGSASTFSASLPISTQGKKYLLFSQNSSTGTGQGGLAFYNFDGDFISGVRQYTAQEVGGFKMTLVTVPDDAETFRVTAYTEFRNEWFGYLTDNENILKYDPSATSGNVHLKIALFGNSYTADCWRYVPKMLLAYGITMESYFYYRGSGSLYDLDTQWTHDSATDIADLDGAQHSRITFYVNSKSSPNWTTATRRSASAVLDMRQWDIISLQQGGNRNLDINSFYPSLQNIIDKIETQAPYPKTLCWFMAYNGASQNVQEGACQQSLDTQKQIIKSFPFNMIVPAAPAVFNAQQNVGLADLGDSSYKRMYASDNTHLQEGLPAYLGACAVVQAILNKYRPGKSVLGDTFRATAENIANLGMSATANGQSTGVSDANCYLAQKAAIVANNSPYEIIPA